MNARIKIISVAVAALLAAGCGSAPKEEQAAAPAESMGTTTATKKEVVTKEAAPAPAPAAAPAPKMMASKTSGARPKIEAPTDPNTFLIHSFDKTKEHPYFGQGSTMGFSVNGVEGNDVAVVRGRKYTFKVDTGIQHDFYLSTSPAGWGAGAYADGVEGQFVYQGNVTFKPGKKTPDLLYYQCRNHKYMGGKIYVLDKGENLAQLKAKLAKSDVAGSAQPKRKMAVTKGAVKQKLGYAQMVLGSGSAKRVQASGNKEAISTLAQAKTLIKQASASLDAGKTTEAMDQVNEGLRMVTAASRMITTESEMAGVNHKAQHEEILNALKTYEGSYERNMARAKKMKQTPKSKLDKSAYDKLVNEGKALGRKGKYAEANKELEKAQAMITAVLTDMLHAQTVVYDKKFETPKEEYEYELARLENYEELIPLAIEQKQPQQNALKLIDGFVKKAAKIKGEGQEVAKKGDYKMAILAMKAATDNLQRALRMMGVN